MGNDQLSVHVAVCDLEPVLPDWPDITRDKARLALAEQQFLVGDGVLLGTVKHLGEEERNQLTVEAMSTEAVTTSEIEAEILDRASVQSSKDVNTRLKDLRPPLGTVVEGEDNDAGMIDGIGCDKGCIRNHQLTSARHPA